MSTHPVTVAAPRSLAETASPFLVERDDPDFVGAVLAELPTAAGRARLASTRAAARDARQVLKLYPPVQRRFHLALVEAWCETAGRPRIDPTRVDAAGLVLRRVRSGATGPVLEGWMSASGTLRGWVPVDRLGAGCSDPDPGVRRAQGATGVASLDLALRTLSAGSDASLLEEDVSPMFVAPPDVCASSGRTVYYGVVPTASGELAQTEPDVDAAFEGFGADSDAFGEHLVAPLRGQGFTFPTPPLSDRRFDGTWLETLLERSPTSREGLFLRLLRQVAVEFDAFGASAAASDVRAELEDISLEYARDEGASRRRTVSAARFLQDAVDVLLDGAGGTVEMPERWPAMDADTTDRLARSLSAGLRERFRSVTGRPGRFDEPDAEYVIAPWYESVGEPVKIALPDLSDRNLLKSLKPNVAFTLPPALQGLLSGNPKDLMEGKAGGASFGIGWICSFSIPVITFCAFIVLNIFLSLFDLIFNWMLWIKVCIPYPKAK
jgi:hypothetical protein